MHRLKKLFPQSLKNLYHLVQAILANVYYGFPTRKLKVIGVTGTDGKTTTVQMITRILEEAGKKVAMASTINYRVNGCEEKNLSHYTTLSAFAVQKFAARAVAEGCEYLILETSSHALDQHRVWGVNYQTAVITNVTREHLDYHGTIEKYRQTKKKLFQIVARKSSVIGHRLSVIVNLDMENPDEFLKYDADKKFGYSVGNSELLITDDRLQKIVAQDIQLGINGSLYEIQNTRYEIHLPALFNVENALAATCVALSEGIDLETIKEALAKINGVPGRMESVVNNKGLNIIVDFALTPEALEKLYSFLGETKKEGAKIIAVFGSCGERDRGKRPIMGKVVSAHADYIIITDDEPYREDPVQIIEEISKGIENKTEGENFWKIPDRQQAIKKALAIAKAGDIIAVTGMGAEESMVVGTEKIPWNDRKVIEEELQN